MIQQKSFGGVGYPLGIMMSFTAEWKLVHISLYSLLSILSRFENLNKTLEFTGLLSTAHACAYINIHRQAGPTGCATHPPSVAMVCILYSTTKAGCLATLFFFGNYELFFEEKRKSWHTQTKSIEKCSG
jgi:hypothetical protein